MALPGITTVLKDRFLALSRTDIPIGPLVVAIGSRNVNATSSAKDFDPFFASSEEQVIDAFGEDSQLHRAYVELVAGGATRVALVALPNGTTDSDLSSTAATGVFQQAFDAAETVSPDIIVPWGRGGSPTDWENPATPANDEPFGFYADNATNTSSMVYRVAKACENITSRSHPCFAVLGVKPWVGSGIAATEGISSADVVSHLEFNNLISLDATQMGNYGPYVSVVGSELAPLGYRDEWGYSNGAGLYAGAICQLDSWSATTGKIIYNVSKQRYNPTRTQQEGLANRGVVPVAQNYNRVPTWIDGRTFAKTGSDYARLSTLRIVYDSVNVVRQVAQKFVGEGATLQNRNALEGGISGALRGMQVLGALLYSDFKVSYIPLENKALVDLVLRPAFELRNIEITVAVQF